MEVQDSQPSNQPSFRLPQEDSWLLSDFTWEPEAMVWCLHVPFDLILTPAHTDRRTTRGKHAAFIVTAREPGAFSRGRCGCVTDSPLREEDRLLAAPSRLSSS